MKDVIVIKIGGVASQRLDQDFLNQLAQWRAAGKQLIIVHGGGYAIDELMALRQLAVEKLDGLRVTPLESMHCVEEGLKQIVGPQLVNTLNQAGLEALQINHQLDRIIVADFLDKTTYGYVGYVSQVSQTYLSQLLQEGLIPVIPSLGVSSSGQLLNINADDVASQLAVALQAETLVLMTDVSGVKEAGEVIPQLTVDDVEEKIAGGVITGNMIPKVRGAAAAVQAGVKRVCIGKKLTGGTQILLG